MHSSLRLLVKLAVAAALTFGMCELILTFAGDRILAGGLYQHDAEMGFRVRPRAVWGGEATNALGFNDRDHTVEKPAGVFRIVVLGDSFNWAGGRTGNYTALLQQRLDRRPSAQRIEIMNAGYPGTHTAEQIAALRRLVLPYDPDLVVLAVYVGNDILDAHPWRKVLPIGGVLTPIDTRRDLLATVFGQPIVTRSHLLQFARGRLESLRRQRNKDETSAPRSTRCPDPVMTDSLYFAIERDRMRICAIQPAPDVAEGYTFALEQIETLRALLAARGISLLVVALPDEFQVDEALERAILEHAPTEPRDFDWALPQRRIGDWCARHGIPYLDLLPAFRAATAAGNRLYLCNEPHWNAAGNALAADLLDSYLTTPRSDGLPLAPAS